ncbi:MAG: SGNH/GDSL hydrolase family protein [Acidobacteriota bacterium]
MIRRIGSMVCALLLGTVAFAQTQAPTAPAPTPEEVAARARLQQERLLLDWSNLGRYRDQNAQLARPAAGEHRVVFMGDSITDGWGRTSPFFPGKPYVNRGISGQTTPQMVVRFRQDVVALAPAAVVILAGTNDIAGNTGPSTPEMIEDNFMSMVDIARENNIAVVLASILPASDYPWKPGLDPGPKIAALNKWMKAYAGKRHVVYLDYYSAMVNGTLGLNPELAGDGVHPTPAGYAIMAPLAEKAIAEALKKK